MFIASAVASVAPRIVSPTDEIAALFGEPLTKPTEKWSRKRLSDDKNIDLALTALEGVRAVKTFLLEATKPAAASSNLAMNLLVDCLSYVAENIESYASTLELACMNTSANRCTKQAHQNLTGEDRCRQEGDQLLVRDIEEVSAEDTLRLTLEDIRQDDQPVENTEKQWGGRGKTTCALRTVRADCCRERLIR